MTITDRKSYEQFCPMATALDFVGDRWTILILRELLGGPARFQQLKDGLPGIATNLLSDRLRRMESDGIVRHADSGVYSLTPDGARIRTAIEELGIWATRMGRVAPPVHERSIRAVAMALQSILVRAGDRLPDEPVTIELDVDGDQAEVVLGPKPTVIARPALEADARVAVSAAAMSTYLLEGVDPDEFRHIDGDERASDQLLIALGIR